MYFFFMWHEKVNSMNNYHQIILSRFLGNFSFFVKRYLHKAFPLISKYVLKNAQR